MQNWRRILINVGASHRRRGTHEDQSEALKQVYQSLVHGRSDLAAEAIAAMMATEATRRDGLIAQAWTDLLEGRSPAVLSDIDEPPALLMVFAPLPEGQMPGVDELIEAIYAEPIETSDVAALELMHRTSQLEAVAARLDRDAQGITKASRLHRLSIDCGLVRPQQILNGVLYRPTSNN